MGITSLTTKVSIGLYDSELSKLSLHLYSPVDFAQIVIECAKTIVLYHNRKPNNKGKYTGQLILNQISNNQIRVFIYHQNHKYVSFNFPFFFNSKDNRLTCYSHTIDATILYKLETIIQKLHSERKIRKYGRFNLPITLSEIGESIINDSDNDDNISLFEIYLCSILLSMEPGYIRYDYDENSANGKIHPIHHLDINYSKSATYKYGLYKKLEFNQFEDFFIKDSEKLYLHPYHKMLDNYKNTSKKRHGKSFNKRLKKRK